MFDTDTYRGFEGLSATQVKELIEKEGKPSDYEGRQNESPSVKEMLDLSEKYPEITYEGYVIGKPREDWRVSLEGFTILASSEETFDLVVEYRSADELQNEPTNTKGIQRIRFWWD